jgi:predicted dithiol-disulfide oxidoreductase (DUF899 family)
MTYEESLAAQEKRVREETEKLLAMHREQPARKIEDYTLNTVEGPRVLSSFFRDKSEMFLIHNMGKKCSYCTLWADGLIGLSGHLQDRAALLLVNGDDVPAQREFAERRGWNFPMASTLGTTVFQDLGFFDVVKKIDWPGVSVITKDADGQLWQKTKAGFGPGDLFCSLWSFVGLLPSKLDWSPKYKY